MENSSSAAFPAHMGSTNANLIPHIKASLTAKMERLLSRPVVAAIVGMPVPDFPPASGEGASLVTAFQRAARLYRPTLGLSSQASAWSENPNDGTCTIRVSLDYKEMWRDREKELAQIVSSAVESPVAFLTADQKAILERSPHAFLSLRARPECSELVSVEFDVIGGVEQIVSVTLAAAPMHPKDIQFIAIIPNLIQLERQLDAIAVLETAAENGPLAALRHLVGLPSVPLATAAAERPEVAMGDQLDEHQRECIAKAMRTPHFAVIHGPPGSGKTTVIASILKQATDRGERVLVISPTHVAVDNVVEKLTSTNDSSTTARLNPCNLPVRYAARQSKLLERAREYWVGSNKQLRAATISKKIEDCLTRAVPFAASLYAMEDQNAAGRSPISSAVAAYEQVICGTPIGILSYKPVQNAASGTYDLLIVDEVSKMTLPEFLAVAVKARRWVLVGDPQQLPPFNDSEDNACTLDDLLDPELELVCSVAGFLERAYPSVRSEQRVAVVASKPERLLPAIRSHLQEVGMEHVPTLSTFGDGAAGGVVVCTKDELDAACMAISQVRFRERSTNPNNEGSVHILVERGIRIDRPTAGFGRVFVDPRCRAQATVFETGFNVYHAKPWGDRAQQRLTVCAFRNGLAKYLPTRSAIEVLQGLDASQAQIARERLISSISLRFGLNTVSVYELLTGIPTNSLDVSPLQELVCLSNPALTATIAPFAGKLTKQYRMHHSLSRVPRELFYFGDALQDGIPGTDRECRVALVQVDAQADGRESNQREADRICEILRDVDADASDGRGVMIITPYREQEALLSDAIGELRARNLLRSRPEICTLDRCQGREAEYVIISLVRGRASTFMDMPKRWNVALTRARKQLLIVGDLDAYLGEAARARRDIRRGETRVKMSLLARVIEAYDRHIADTNAGWQSTEQAALVA